MIPAEKPRRASINFGEMLFMMKAGPAPIPLARPAPRLANKPIQITFISGIKSIYRKILSSEPPTAPGYREFLTKESKPLITARIVPTAVNESQTEFPARHNSSLFL